MTRTRCSRSSVTILLLVLATVDLRTAPPAEAQPSQAAALSVVSAGPAGEVASLAEANEIRIVFSEPMVTLGRIPAVVSAPYVRILPAMRGTFRWSGTTILIFTPDPRSPLPFATKYEVTVETTAVGVSGRRMAEPYRFSFSTPATRLLETRWYRRGGRADAAVVVLLRFNQRVRPADVEASLTAAFEPHEWKPPAFGAADESRLRSIDPTAVARFQARVRETLSVASARSPVRFGLTNDWDRKMFPPSPDLVVLESVDRVPSESWLRLSLSDQLPSPAGVEVPGTVQSYTVKVEPAFFIDGFRCRTSCDPDDWNPIQMRNDVKTSALAAAVRVADVTDLSAPRDVSKAAAAKPRRSYALDESSRLTLEDAGFDAQPPARTYAVTVDANLAAADGQRLGYTWVGTVENWHQRAFTSFGDGHGVWETGGGTQLPFYARNFLNATQWAAPIGVRDLMPTLRQLMPRFDVAPAEGGGIERRLGGAPDRIHSHGLDLATALAGRPTGLVWAAVREGDPIDRASRYGGHGRVRASVVQVTNLGITVKDSPQNTLIFVTRLDTGAPVPGARVSIVRLDNRIHWSGVTDVDGVAIAPQTPLRDHEDWWRFAFLVTAEKDGDVAYAGSDWNEGVMPWDFGMPYNIQEAAPLLRGSVFSDRGVYRLGEEVHLKAILRHNTAAGIRMLAEGTPLYAVLRDGQGREVDSRTVKTNTWSSAEWTVTIPADGALGSYWLQVMLESDRPKPRAPEDLDPGEVPGPGTDQAVSYLRVVSGSFLVAAYRRPDFRVDVTLTGASLMAGDELTGVVGARYLFGAPMGPRPLTWSFSKQPVGSAPAAVRENFPEDRWLFVGWSERGPESGEIGRQSGQLTEAGTRELKLNTKRDAGVPYSYVLEGDVEDVSRQHIANRASVVVHPAPWYVGVKRPPYFLDQRTGLQTEVVTVSPSGQAMGGVPVTLTLTQVQWISTRRAEGNGFYTWDSERREIPAGTWTVTTASDPVSVAIPVPNGGYFLLDATARDGDGRHATTRTSFYALGDGYTAWARFDHNRIELVPERKTYKPGETARVMIQSPWEQATALVTTEREGIRSHRRFTLTSTQESIPIPIADADIPNLFVSVLLVKGRTTAPVAAEAGPSGGPHVIEDPGDPGKPSFRLGYVELQVEDASKRLTLAVKANKDEYRPANTARLSVDVKDSRGRGARSEVTLWAVDYGVLSLTAYRTPDVLKSVYVQKALQVMTVDTRQRIVSRRVLTPKGETEGGGGGADAGAGTLRKDFRVLAFWVGSVVTNADGHADVEVKLPESLTTYRIMAVAADRSSRFGSGDTEVRINKPLTLKPTFPRFLAVGDTARFGAVVTSQLAVPGKAAVSIKSLDPEVLAFTAETTRTVEVGADGSVEVRFDAAGRRIGRARVQMMVSIGAERDSFEDVIPVEVLASPETVAGYGEAGSSTPTATETLTIPADVVAGFGGLHVELASTALVGLGEGARYLVEYPYGCAEQRSSRTLAMLLAADLGDAFILPGLDTVKIRPAVQQSLRELERFQCPGGGFAFWPGACYSVSPYLTSYVLHVFKTGVDLGYKVDPAVRDRAYSYLERELAAPPPTNEGWWPAYTAWQAFAVKVLVEGGRNQDSNITRLYGYRDRMPVFALAYLHDAIRSRPQDATSSGRLADLQRRIANAILPEAGSAHVEELSDPYLLWFWNSNIRSTAIVLNTLVRGDLPDAPVRQLVRWMMAARKDGRWGNTQENAHAMEALVAYYRKFEPEAPDFRAVVTLGASELARTEFRGRSTASTMKTVPMAQLIAAGQPGSSRPLTFSREGAGTLFYTTRLRYAADTLFHEGLDAGFRIERTYSPFLEKGSAAAVTTYDAGDLVRITLTFDLTKERRFVAVTDPLPAGFEPVESWFATTTASLAARQDDQGEVDQSWFAWWQRGGFDHVERHDDRVQLFATRLSEGRHEFSYVVRATTAGTFRTAPARAEEMYEPEVFGRTATAVITVRP